MPKDSQYICDELKLAVVLMHFHLHFQHWQSSQIDTWDACIGNKLYNPTEKLTRESRMAGAIGLFTVDKIG
jgi:hypothetical protein